MQIQHGMAAGRLKGEKVIYPQRETGGKGLTESSESNF